MVLLTSHLERYVRSSNEEAIDFINGLNPAAAQIPEGARLRHSRKPVDELFETGWLNRADKLKAFVEEEAWLWTSGISGVLQHERFLEWMRSPKPDELARYYRTWGVEDIFRIVTRTPHTYSALRLRLGELVDKRNRIAHGDFTAEATKADVLDYLASVETWCTRADAVLSRELRRLLSVPRPW